MAKRRAAITHRRRNWVAQVLELGVCRDDGQVASSVRRRVPQHTTNLRVLCEIKVLDANCELRIDNRFDLRVGPLRRPSTFKPADAAGGLDASSPCSLEVNVRGKGRKR